MENFIDSLGTIECFDDGDPRAQSYWTGGWRFRACPTLKSPEVCVASRYVESEPHFLEGEFLIIDDKEMLMSGHCIMPFKRIKLLQAKTLTSRPSSLDIEWESSAFLSKWRVDSAAEGSWSGLWLDYFCFSIAQFVPQAWRSPPSRKRKSSGVGTRSVARTFSTWWWIRARRG